MSDPRYIHLSAGGELPLLPAHPFKAVVIIEMPVTPEWRDLTSTWLVESGCRYMMAWGHECTLWDDSVDWASLEQFDYGNSPDAPFVMTTWHDKEPLSEVLWFAGYAASHPDIMLEQLILIHIAPQGEQARILKAFREARSG